MIHTFKNNGYFIVLDINSGAVHEVDNLAFDLINELDKLKINIYQQDCPKEVLSKLEEKHDVNTLKSVYEEILNIIEEGQLFSKDDIYRTIAEQRTYSPIKAMCLHVSHDCNLRCKYCFAGEGDYGGEKMVMDEGTAKAAIDFLIKESEGRKNLEVDFFGGEPLLNLDVVKKTVEYARSLEKEHGKAFRFTMTTNGMLLDEDTSNYLNKEMNNVVLSLDGRREVNDNMRPNIAGKGSYERIVPKYQYFTSIRGEKDYYVRGTFTNNNLDFSEDVLHMAELGFDQLSVEPVVGEESSPYAITEKDLPKIFDEYNKLAVELLDRKEKGKAFNFFHFMIDLEQGPCAIKRLRGCGCGNEYVAIDPSGNIFPCHQFVGQPEWQMGDVFSQKYSQNMKEEFSMATVYHKKDCEKCWAKFYCSGGCNANNHKYAGSILSPHKISCELEKKRLECAIMMKVALAE